MVKLTYLLLNIAFFFVAALVVQRLDPNPKPRKHLLLAGIVLYLMMIVFNTYLTSLAIVRYDWAKVLGFKIVSWPIEDLAYLVVALYAGPTLWNYFYYRYDSSKSPASQKAGHKPNISSKKTQPNTRRIKAD